jgi:hypothetical protein
MKNKEYVHLYPRPEYEGQDEESLLAPENAVLSQDNNEVKE